MEIKGTFIQKLGLETGGKAWQKQSATQKRKVNELSNVYPGDKQLQDSISKMSDFEFFKIWDELKEFNEIGPTAIDYVEEVQLNGNFINCCTNTTPIIPEGEID